MYTKEEFKADQAATGMTNEQLAESLGVCESTIVKRRAGGRLTEEVRLAMSVLVKRKGKRK